jgi:hypothetical protein
MNGLVVLTVSVIYLFLDRPPLDISVFVSVRTFDLHRFLADLQAFEATPIVHHITSQHVTAQHSTTQVI